MPSTYSNLKIQLMSTGDNTTTWGNVTNTNLGTALEEAIVGSNSVSFSSGNVTLSLTDTNTSQPARKVRLRCTGTTGGARNLIVPAIEKPYIVQNDCADTITVKNSTGAGVAVPAGKTLWVYNNGTDVVDVVTHLTSLTLATPLAVTSGGTGATTASGARTNLGLGTIATQANSSVTITGGSITGITDLAVADGGTGASTASGARTNLGLGTLATLSSVDNSNWSGTVLAVANGGTGANTAAGARSALSAAQSGTNTDITTMNPTGGLQVGSPTGGAKGTGTINATGLYVNGSAVGTGSGSVSSVNASGGTTGLTFSGGPITTSGTLTLAGTLATANGGTGSTSTTYCNLQANVTGTLPLTSGGTGATTASGARTNLGLGTIATQASSSVTITGGSITGITDLAVADGGTGASTASGARTNLGLGTLATLSSVDNSNWSGTVLALTNGGTGASTVAGALSALGFGTGGTAAKGHVDIPIGANTLRVNWGTTTVSGNSSTSDTFDAAFSTLFVGGMIGYDDTGTAKTDNVNGYASSTTTINLTNGDNTSHNLQWLAIGWA